jgi:hypothetical protein
MRSASKVLLFGSQTRAQLVNALIASFAPVGWWSMRATSGTNELNRGSAGAAANGTYTLGAGVLAQTGQLGAGEAALWDGLVTKLQIPNVAALASLTTFEYVMLLNLTALGEGTLGQFFAWGTGSSSNEFHMQFPGTNTMQLHTFNTTPTSFTTTTTTTLGLSAWRVVFVPYNNDGDRKVHIYVGAAGAVSEVTYGTQTALTGTYKAPTNPLVIGNRTAQDLTAAGRFDEFFICSGNLTPAQRTALTVATGV